MSAERPTEDIPAEYVAPDQERDEETDEETSEETDEEKQLRQKDDKEAMQIWAMEWYNHSIVLALMRNATGYTHGHGPVEENVHSFFERPEEEWRNSLYRALINTCWVDTRDGAEYGYSFREASAVVAFLTGVRGGRTGCYMDGPYCTTSEGDFDSGNLRSPGIKFVKSLGFRPRKYPEGRHLTGYSTCNFSRNDHVQVPPFICLPPEMRLALLKYDANGDTEDANSKVRFSSVDKSMPCLKYKNDEPQVDAEPQAKRARAE